MTAEKRFDVLVLGGGPAGIQGSRMIKAGRPDWQVAMLRPEPASMVYCAIPYALEGLIPADKTLKKDSLVTDAGIELLRETALEVDLEGRRVRSEEGNLYGYDRLLIATGAEPIVPPIPGVELDRIATVKSQTDMGRILGFLEDGARRAVVVGAGAIGIEQAMAFRKRGLQVHLVDFQDRILPHLLDGDMSEPAREALVGQGIELHLGEKVARLVGEKAVAAVELSSGRRLELEEGRDFLVFAVGMKAQVGLFAGQLETAPDGLVVDARMATSRPGVFAAGDCVQSISGIDGKPLGGSWPPTPCPRPRWRPATCSARRRNTRASSTAPPRWWRRSAWPARASPRPMRRPGGSLRSVPTGNRRAASP